MREEGDETGVRIRMGRGWGRMGKSVREGGDGIGRVVCSCSAFCLKERNLIARDFTSRSYCNYGTSRSDVGPGLGVMTQSFRGSEEEILLGPDFKKIMVKKFLFRHPMQGKSLTNIPALSY